MTARFAASALVGFQSLPREGRPTLVLAFHKNITQSKGTANMLAQAKRAGVETLLIEGCRDARIDRC